MGVGDGTAARGTRSARWLAAPILAFALVSLLAGLLADHDPRSKGYFRLFFSDPVHLKAGFATAAVALACFQLFNAAWIFRRYSGGCEPGAGRGRIQERRLRRMPHACGGRGDRQVGPNLDKVLPNYATVVARVEKGGGLMPSFKGKLTRAQISDVAAFVASRAGSPHLAR